MTGLDSVYVDMIGSHLLAIAEEMGVVLVRASYSSNVKERRDCSAALLDAEGQTTAQAEHIPLHMGSMLGLVPEIRRHFGDDIHDGDIFISNDPYAGGGTHLPDVTMATPLIADGELCGWAATVAHHTEIGGALSAATDVFAEGLRIPPVRLFSRGELQDDLFRLIVFNCRASDERLGDLRAQVAALKLGVRRYAEMAERHSVPVLLSATGAWLDKAERQARGALASIPPGSYSFEDWMDGDGMGGSDVRIAVTVERRDDGLVLDFEGTDPQVAGAINVVRSALLATVYYAVKVVLDPELPANAGYYRIIEVRAPEGCVVNAVPPAPVLWRSDTCQRIVDVVLGAFAEVVPERVCAACNGAITGIQFSGHDDGRGGFFSYLETLGGGFGARPGSDGPDAVHAHMTNSSNLPVEALELEYPLRVERYGLRDGSGGEGEHRGGLGIVREVRVLADDVYYRSKGDRTTRGPWGLAGGGPGARAEFTLNPGTLEERELDSKQGGLLLHAGDLIRVATPGGGGHGDPARRPSEAHERDVREGKVTGR